VAALVFGLMGAIVLAASVGASVAAVVPPRRARRIVAISTLVFLALTAALVASWGQLPHND
jgi:hypothetical protein